MTDMKRPELGLIANPTNDITIPHYSTALRPQDETLLHRGGGKGIALYREVLKDGRAYSVLQKRKRKLIARNWKIEPASDARIDRKAAAFVDRQLRALNANKMFLGLLDATLMGFSVAEIEWDRSSEGIVPNAIQSIDQRRILFDGFRNPRLLTWQHLATGEALPDRKFIVHRFEDLSSDPYGWGLGRTLFWHVLFKREGVAFWLKALERFATPLPVIKYPLGTLEADQQRLLDAVSGALVEGALVVPIGTEVAFATAAVSGTVTHEAWCRYWDEQTSETVLGQTLSTNLGLGGGSRAATETHKTIEDELVDGDAELLDATLRETLIRWLVEYNFPDAHIPALVHERPSNVLADEMAKAARASRQASDLANFVSMQRLGFVPADQLAYVADVMGAELVEAPPVVGPALPAVAPVAGEDAATAFAGETDQDIDSDADTLDAHATPIIAKWVDRVRQAIADLVARGGTLSDLPDALLTLYPDLPADRLGQLIGAALTNADLRGRADIVDRRA